MCFSESLKKNVELRLNTNILSKIFFLNYLSSFIESVKKKMKLEVDYWHGSCFSIWMIQMQIIFVFKKKKLTANCQQ
jgi:hypothetical protein